MRREFTSIVQVQHVGYVAPCFTPAFLEPERTVSASSQPKMDLDLLHRSAKTTSVRKCFLTWGFSWRKTSEVENP